MCNLYLIGIAIFTAFISSRRIVASYVSVSMCSHGFSYTVSTRRPFTITINTRLMEYKLQHVDNGICNLTLTSSKTLYWKLTSFQVTSHYHCTPALLIDSRRITRAHQGCGSPEYELSHQYTNHSKTVQLQILRDKKNINYLTATVVFSTHKDISVSMCSHGFSYTVSTRKPFRMTINTRLMEYKLQHVDNGICNLTLTSSKTLYWKLTSFQVTSHYYCTPALFIDSRRITRVNTFYTTARAHRGCGSPEYELSHQYTNHSRTVQLQILRDKNNINHLTATVVFSTHSINKESKDKDFFNVGRLVWKIVGSVLGAIVFIAIIITIVCCYCFRQKTPQATTNSAAWTVTNQSQAGVLMSNNPAGTPVVSYPITNQVPVPHQAASVPNPLPFFAPYYTHPLPEDSPPSYEELMTQDPSFVSKSPIN